MVQRKLKKGSKHGKDDERNGVAGDEELATVEGQERLDNLDISDELSALGTVEGGPDSSPDGSKPSRGRRGKLKKIKEKYAEQDEEERQLRMSLLASAGRKESKEPKALRVNGKASTSSKTIQ